MIINIKNRPTFFKNYANRFGMIRNTITTENVSETKQKYDRYWQGFSKRDSRGFTWSGLGLKCLEAGSQ